VILNYSKKTKLPIKKSLTSSAKFGVNAAKGVLNLGKSIAKVVTGVTKLNGKKGGERIYIPQKQYITYTI
jgi:hypothetical protein